MFLKFVLRHKEDIDLDDLSRLVTVLEQQEKPVIAENISHNSRSSDEKFRSELTLLDEYVKDCIFQR